MNRFVVYRLCGGGIGLVVEGDKDGQARARQCENVVVKISRIY